ncbi:MAG: STAS domain-containing protein [Prolixibacteraceae bacterium]|nr:STAS domain-containing protein [Prolixibacteraceae bacterium]MBN2650176.1 STAS domain-containing protein [Prolixibacteraceae bacterium]
MELTTNKKGDFTIAEINGRIDTTNYNEFETQIMDVIEKGEKNIILNCEGLNYISSSGLRVFLITQKKLMGLKGKLHLCNMQPAIKEIFDMSGFSSIFKIFNTEEEALE